MAIALDNSATSTVTNATSKTLANYAATSTNPYVIVQVTLGSSTDAVTGVTFNGVGMTQLVKRQGGGFYSYLYGIAAGGTHDVVVSCGSTQFIQINVVSYSGVNQSTATDGTNSASTTGTDGSAAITTTVTGDWIVTAFAVDANITVGSGTTQRQLDATNYQAAIGDSNGTVAVGSNTLHWTSDNGAKTWTVTMVAIQPAAATAIAPANRPILQAVNRAATF